MAGKQIIIDGVDVSECENLMQGIVPFGCMEDRKTCSCMNNPNCLYKQLKRKEEECEELKKRLESFQKDYSKLYQVVENKGYIKELDQLKIENNQFKQTLAEIKEIAETAAKCFYATKSDDYADGYRWLGNKILQKISECEANNDR